MYKIVIRKQAVKAQNFSLGGGEIGLKEKKKADIPFMIGLTILILVIGLMAGFFWQTVKAKSRSLFRFPQRTF